jgi:multicomponent Na+:H+ antiporter subunit D
MVAAAEGHYDFTWYVLLFAAAGVFHHAGIKIPFFAFFAHDRGIRVEEAPRNMLVAMGAAAFLCLAMGVYPASLYRLLPYAVDYHPYTTTHVVTVLQLLLFSALAFTFLQRTGLYPPELRSVILDSDWVYRRALPTLGGAVALRYWRVRDATFGAFHRGRRRLLGEVERASRPWGVLGEPWPTGATAMWAALLLLAYLFVYY